MTPASEARVWVVMRSKDGYACTTCGWKVRDDRGTYATALTPVFALATPRRGDDTLHEFEVCEECLLTCFPNAVNPFGIGYGPQEPRYV